MSWIEELKQKLKSRQELDDSVRRLNEIMSLEWARQDYSKAVKMPIHGRDAVEAWKTFLVIKDSQGRTRCDPEFDEDGSYYSNVFYLTTQAVFEDWNDSKAMNELLFYRWPDYQKSPLTCSQQESAAFMLMNWESYNKYAKLLDQAADRVCSRLVILKWLEEER